MEIKDRIVLNLLKYGAIQKLLEEIDNE